MTTPDRPAAQSNLPRWVKALIIASFALNLLVFGSVAGMALRGFGGKPPLAEAQAPGFGPWTGALQREDYRALRRNFDAKGLDFRAFARADREDRAALASALRADPFDIAAFDAAHERLNKRALERLELGQDLMRAHVLGLTPKRRQDLATRLEKRVRRGADRVEKR